MKREYIVVGIIFLLVFGIRLLLAFQTNYFSSDEAYYNIRQVVHIKETFLPMIKDDLSYGGKTLYLPPLFFYLLAALSYIFKTEFVGKFFPNLFASCIVIVGYLISAELTKKESAIILTTLLAGFVPIFFSETLNSISINSFVIPLMFFSIYCMMRVIDNDKFFIFLFIESLLILRATTPEAIFLIFALLVYLLFAYLEKMKILKIETELIVFSTFMIIWTLFIFFKNAFLNYGLSILWQNIPKELLKNYFANTNILTVIYFIGIIPFIFGLYSIYKFAFREKDKKTYLLISFAVIIGFLMWLRLIELILAITLIGFTFVFLSVKPYTLLLDLIKTRRTRIIIVCAVFLIVLISSILPSIVLASNKINHAYSENEIQALLWIRQNTDEESVILSTLNEGHLIAGIAKRKNVIDSNFMFVEKLDKRLEDVHTMYVTTSQTQAIELLNEYSIKYIYFSKRAKEEYKIKTLHYLDDKCFKEVFSNSDVQIYQSLCVIEER